MNPIRETWTSADGQHRILWGDCLEILPTLDTSEVAAVLADPPYGISYCHGARKDGVKLGTDCLSIHGDDMPFDPSPFLEFPCVLWGAEHYKERLPKGGRWLVWDKRRDGVQRDQADVENAWCSINGVARMKRLAWDGADKEEERGVARLHSNQKPVALMIWCISFLPPGLILDPFAGSCTVAVACARTGRRSISIEIEERYFRIGIDRMEREAARMPLFSEKPLTQRSLI